jgi:hypothetical protein
MTCLDLRVHSFSPARKGKELGGLSMATRKIGRDAGTGQFKPVKEAQKDKKGSVVETIKVPPKTTPPKKGK